MSFYKDIDYSFTNIPTIVEHLVFTFLIHLQNQFLLPVQIKVKDNL